MGELRSGWKTMWRDGKDRGSKQQAADSRQQAVEMAAAPLPSSAWSMPDAALSHLASVSSSQ
ncbi:hypothetical protein A7D17_18850 [Xanthomonas floridensis]|uniref:Uncharacterized protein n=1 Tax=Xanthomonas floridensis TaxID=1843580 RepID=A0A1A9M9L4_9XANT|nr:hypothetical protein A7D17_18850 [Xanthomonas floridensis]